MKRHDKKKQRLLNTADVLVVAFGAMIGWGWVVMSGDWIRHGGVIGTAIAFVIGGAMIYFVGLCYAELTTALPKSGGIKVFAYLAFGKAGAFVCSWAIILSYIAVVCFEAVSLPTVLQYLFPGFTFGKMYTIIGYDIYLSWTLVSVVAATVVMCLNLIGAKSAAIMQNILTIVIAGVGIMLVAGSVFSGDVQNLSGQFFVGENFNSAIYGVAKISILTPFFLFGFDVIPQVAAEINVPAKKIGVLMIGSIVLAVIFYIMVVASVGFLMSQSEICKSMETTGLVTVDAMKKAFQSENMARIVIIGGICGIITSWNSFLLGGSRAFSSLAESHMLPVGFSKNGAYSETPIYAVILISVISIAAAFFGRPVLTWFVDAGNFSCCLSYFMVSVSFLIIRKKYPDLARPYRIKHYKFVGIMAVLLSGLMTVLYILPNTNCTLTAVEWGIVAGWAVLGAILAAYCRAKYKTEFGSNIGLSETI